jgi:phosphoribosylformylglycinamidine synthase subunit PurS
MSAGRLGDGRSRLAASESRLHLECLVARVVVDVMPKPEILDPQGKAVHGALPRLGFDGVTDVRQGKRFELQIDGELTDERMSQIRVMAATILSNPVIEDFEVRVVEGTPR